MFINFTSHSTEKGTSSSDLFNYLEKENSVLGTGSAELKEEEFFFNQNMNLEILRNADSRISMSEAIQQIDENRGTQNLKSSNFYMLNVSPSEKELKHLEMIAISELEKKGLVLSQIENNSELLSFYNEQKDELMRMQMKMYAQEVMKVYADEMNREVYSNQDALPNNKQRKEMKPIIENEWNKFLQEKGIIEIKEIEKIEIPLESEVTGSSKKGRFFNIENEKIFIPNDLIKQNENSISVNKEFLDRQILLSQQKKDSNSIKLNVEIKKEQNDKILVEYKPENHENKVVLWINKSDIVEQNINELTLKEQRGKYLVEQAINRDISDKKPIELDRKNFKEIQKSGDKEKYVFELKKQGLEKPLKLTFDSSQVNVTEKGFEVKNHVYSKAYENAIKYNSNNQFSTEKENIKNSVWKDNGFDTTKRKLEHTDLLYFGKVEKNRTYKFDDKDVLENKRINGEIKIAKEKENFKEVKNLEKQLIKDKETGEIVKEGNVKGGLNYHTHIVVSRHDNFNRNPLDKVSMSPVSNQKDSTMNHGKKVGFDRKDFREKTEIVFDKAFKYERPLQETFAYKNTALQNAKGKVESFVISKIKNEVLEKTGIYEIKRELNPIGNIKKEIGFFPVPSSLPKSKIDLLMKAIKIIKTVSFDKGISH